MKTKLQVALEALDWIRTLQLHEVSQEAQKAVDDIRAMPEENCLNCENFIPMTEENLYHECDRGVLTDDFKETDFCSRFEPKEK